MKPAKLPRSLAEVAELHKSKFSGVLRVCIIPRQAATPSPILIPVEKIGAFSDNSTLLFGTLLPVILEGNVWASIEG